ncbi:MAG: hypothetical protein OEO23_13675, partial [Gemmatimonadota bacterium]|nr:hypothetical protein [Gemmatimonadota bacterium]
WLRGEGGFTNSEMRSLRTGAPLVRIVDSESLATLSLLGAVRVATTPASVIALFNRPSEFLATPSTLAAGQVHIPPRIDDFRTIRLPPSDLPELAACRPGSCKVKLALGPMADLGEAARGPPIDREASVTARFRSMLFDYADSFVRQGLDGLPEYVDKARPLSTAAAMAPLRALDPSFFEQSRVLTRHLRAFPHSTAEGVTDRMAWTLEDVGLRPTVRLLHLALIQPPDAPSVDALIAIQQLYATHYLQASITYLSLVIDTSVAGEAARFLVLLSRFSFDGEVTGIRRSALVRSSVANQEARLRTLQQRLRP